jgi:hypothetical protein
MLALSWRAISAKQSIDSTPESLAAKRDGRRNDIEDEAK